MVANQSNTTDGKASFKYAHWALTGRCNCFCKHCIVSAPINKYKEPTTQQCFEIIEELKHCGVKIISLTGGECLLREDLFQIIDGLISENIRISTIYSNGLLVTEDFLSKLKQRNIFPELNMSYDGNGWHDWLRGIDGAEEAVLEAFKLCRKEGFPTGAEFCLHKGNLHTLRESINTLASVGVQRIKTNPIVPSELWAEYEDKYGITDEEVYEAYLSYIPQFFEDNALVDVALGGLFEYSRYLKRFCIPVYKFGGDFRSGGCALCGHAKTTLYISADCKLMPCMPFSSTIFEENFPSIFNGGIAQGIQDTYYQNVIEKTIDEFLEINEKCAACKYRYLCGGGCRAGNLEDRTKLFSPDISTCKIFLDGYAQKVINLAKPLLAEHNKKLAENNSL